MIYTKTGDNGTTSLVGGTRVDKCCPRLDAYGTADELNSHIGLLRSLIASQKQFAEEDKILTQIQNNLFVIGSILACEKEKQDLLKIENWNAEAETQNLEHEIDHMTEELPKLHSFILPVGCQSACQAHICRTVCRRLEREIWKLDDDCEVIVAEIAKYVNRLSDYFFVLARWLNFKTETIEQIWK